MRAAVVPSARWVSGDVAAASGRRTHGGAATGRAPVRHAPVAGRDLAWVRLMRARVPAFDALEPGDVAIVPVAALAVVAPDRDGVVALVRGCVEAGVAGLLIVTEAGGPAESSTSLAEVAAAAGLPALDVGAADSAAIERSVIGFLVNHRAELERQATLLERRLEDIALGGGGAEGLAAAIAGFLGRAVAIEGRRGATVAVHAPPDVADAAVAVSAYHGRRRVAAARVPLPIPGGEPGATGALALLGQRPASELERIATARIAGLVALELARDEELGRAIEGARREVLPPAGPPWVVIVARQAPPDPGGETDGSVRLSDAPRHEAERRETLRRDLRSLAPARRLSLRGDAQSVEIRIVAALDPADPEGVALAGRIAGFLGRLVALSRPFAEPAGRSSAEADARATLEAAEALGEPPLVARADRLPAYRLLGNLHNLPDGTRQARALLAPLLRGRPDVRRERLATLRAVLDQPGLAEAANALGVHRNTIAYRVHRIEEATGWRLADPELRLPLALALRLVHED
ncbi:MAG TPA: helix-turn-helix domain-containing protein [Candidatus Limnocylindrales bacterium]|nr:helix-turn-helix domain-containing protein [Candidatus Limnocylindrales bacterium]